MDNDREDAPQAVKCIGILGWLRGHKFNTNTFDYIGEPMNFCQRCGYKP